MDELIRAFLALINAIRKNHWLQVVIVILAVLFILWWGLQSDDLSPSLTTLLKSVLESPEFRGLVISAVTLGSVVLFTQRTRLVMQADNEKKQAEAAAALEVKLQDKVREVEIEKDRQVNLSLEAFRLAFADDRRKFDAERLAWEIERAALVATNTEWRNKHETREKEIKAFIEQQATDAKRIEVLEDDKRQRDGQLVTLNKRVEALEQERDGLAQQVRERDKDLQKRDQTIARQEGEIKTLSDKVEALQKQVNALEKKTDTVQIEASKPSDT